jgi:hypothetical protein
VRSQQAAGEDRVAVDPLPVAVQQRKLSDRCRVRGLLPRMLEHRALQQRDGGGEVSAFDRDAPRVRPAEGRTRDHDDDGR